MVTVVEAGNMLTMPNAEDNSAPKSPNQISTSRSMFWSRLSDCLLCSQQWDWHIPHMLSHAACASHAALRCPWAVLAELELCPLRGRCALQAAMLQSRQTSDCRGGAAASICSAVS